MIKVPATAAGLAALEDLAAAGVTLNVTLIFSPRQYKAAREAVWRRAPAPQRSGQFNSVYSIFVSRVDVYTEEARAAAFPGSAGPGRHRQRQAHLADESRFWSDKKLPLKQEIIFASTGTKNADDPAWKYVEALAGCDIQTNPPATNDAVEQSGQTFTRQVDQMPPADVLEEIERLVDMQHMEETLMAEGIAKFAEPQYKLTGADR